MKEKIIESKSCKHCNISFNITDKDLEFYDKISPIFNGEKLGIPIPIFCPDCREQRRLSFRNERKLYKRDCDATGKQIISIHNQDKKYKVYNQEFWWSDKWDAMDYGLEFDFGKTFFEQYNKLSNSVPKASLLTNFKEDKNSAYTNFAGGNKNCYLAFDSDFNEDCINITSSTKNKNCIDCNYTHNSEICYEGTGVEKSYKCFFVNNIIDCSNCYFSENLIGCKNCFGCTNLTNKEYCIYNKEFTKEEYSEKIEDLLKNTQIDFDKFNSFPKKCIISTNSENISGNYIFNSKNITESYEIYDSRDCKYCFGLHDVSDCYDLNYFGFEGLKNVYDSHVVGIGGNNILFSNCIVGNNSNILYSDYVYNNSSNLFGCIGLVSKQYCILNKQFTKEEYENLVPKIIEHMKNNGEWGEFFPSSISPFGYNETTALEYFPLSKEEALNNGFNWSDHESPKLKVDKIIPANKLPFNIKNIPDDILNWAIECDITKKPFRIIKEELEFYRKYNLPIPKKHPDERNLDRLKLRNPRKLFDRKCDKCGINIKTSYSSDREEIIYCQKCYDKEIY